MKWLLAGWVMLHAFVINAQDPEFPKHEFIMHLRLHSGLVTDFSAAPDLFTGGIQVVPQYTVVENHLRAGLIGDIFYTGKKIQGAAGPTLSVRLKSISVNDLGSGGNINFSIEHLWGTGRQRLLGGGLHLDLLNRIVISTSLHRDYKNNNWWLQGALAFRISKLKSIPHP